MKIQILNHTVEIIVTKTPPNPFKLGNKQKRIAMDEIDQLVINAEKPLTKFQRILYTRVYFKGDSYFWGLREAKNWVEENYPHGETVNECY